MMKPVSVMKQLRNLEQLRTQVDKTANALAELWLQSSPTGATMFLTDEEAATMKELFFRSMTALNTVEGKIESRLLVATELMQSRAYPDTVTMADVLIKETDELTRELMA
jgi:hypothetical protein